MSISPELTLRTYFLTKSMFYFNIWLILIETCLPNENKHPFSFYFIKHIAHSVQ